MIELLALPGIGDYTASAVLSLRFRRTHRGGRYQYPPCDHHPPRSPSAVRQVLWSVETARRSLLPEGERGSVVSRNQSVMELGRDGMHRQGAAVMDPITGQCVFLLRNAQARLGGAAPTGRANSTGTDRQVRWAGTRWRSRIPAAGSVLEREQAERLWRDRIQLDACIASLDDECSRRLVRLLSR